MLSGVQSNLLVKFILATNTQRIAQLTVKWKNQFCGGSDSFLEVATGDVPYEKVFLEISQNSQENPCARESFLIKLQVSGNVY